MDFLGKKCPVCSKNFHEDDDIVVCPKCGAPYHRKCYNEKGKCIFTNLHKNGERWKSEEEQQEEKQSAHFEPCPYCGKHNPKNAITCHACGEFLHKESNGFNSNKTQNVFNPFGDEQQNNGIPFILIDPMGGVSPEEDFDGVTGAEIAKSVKVNTPYYMQIFSRIKVTGTSKFNFAALFFGGGWYLYRKQYLKGTIITLLMFLLSFGQDICMIFSSSMWKNIIELAGNNANYQTYFSLIFSHYSLEQAVLMLLPYILGLLYWILMFCCGFRANRSYYKHTIKKVKKIKSEKNSEEIPKVLTEKGGVNTAIAWTFLACEFILTISLMLFY